MNTRQGDMNKIEEDMAKGLISRTRGKDLLEKIYKQSTNNDLEEKRKRMIKKQQESIKFNKDLRTNPRKLGAEKEKLAVEYFLNHPEEF